MCDCITSNMSLLGMKKLSYTIKEMYQKTHPISKKNKTGCRATLIKVDRENYIWTFRVKCNNKDSKGPYIVRIGLTNLDQALLPVDERDITIYCSCNFFWFYGAAYNAYIEGYLQGKSKRGIPKNPHDNVRHRVKLCKHIAAALFPVRSYMNNIYLSDLSKQEEIDI